MNLNSYIFRNLILSVIAVVCFSCGSHLYKSTTLDSMRCLPLDSGFSKIFASDASSVRNAVDTAITELDMRIVDEVQVNDSLWVIFAESEYSAFKGVGEVLRASIEKKNEYETCLYVTSERKWTIFFIASPDNSDDIFERVQHTLQESNQLSNPTQLARFEATKNRVKKQIAVFPLEAVNLSEFEINTLTNRLISELFQTGLFIVLEQEKLTEILAEQNFQQTGCTSSECLVKAGQILKVEQIVAGRVAQKGNIFGIRFYLIDVRSGNTLTTVSKYIEGTIGDVLTKGITEAVQDLAFGT